ncbi:FtsK/SpoIIIE domain-containing protein [Actinomyces israelii]|uniref:FtsK/SpoIIIE domain-containing protein n=1 Tax=Actinomyces israelii TaxID=1659 RepID=A0ABT4I9S2_9ACTO|nr:FtsK/SpoIIIE domain-containing protein [Actinomyces israelii]MCZ0858475.1 FtsK/SpoIIIE domain-containing protein [Actinomyces israelii]WKR21457.1 hypothetical protein AIF0345_1368 [Actinomyces israelii]
MPSPSPAGPAPGTLHDPPAEAPHAGARAAREALSRPWHLAVLTGPDAGLVLPVPAEGTVGRGEVMTDPAVSRRHLLLGTTAKSVTVADAGSVNGTHVRRGLWWRSLGRRRARCRAGALVLVGDTLLEVRRRPHDLTVPAPAGRSRRRWVRAAVVAAALMLVVVAAVAMRATGRGAYGLLAVAPMVLMAVMRLGSPAPGGERGRRRPAGAGWCGRDPDPPSMLLSLAVRADEQAAAAAQDGPRTAWLARRRRADLLELAAGQRTALTGPSSRAAVRWWIAQIAARGRAHVAATDQGYRLTWGREAAACRAELLAAPGAPPGRARTVRAAPSGAPLLGERWWEAAGELMGLGSSRASAEVAAPDEVALEEVTGPVDRDGIGARWRLQVSRGGSGALPAVLGVRGGREVTADLVGDGPHALMAGTTGSGKSELLTSWLLQLALGLPPSRLALILVDYKGGAAFGPLARLPHTAGVLTDLDPAATARALASLEAEVRRRERLLAEAGAKDVRAVSPAQAPPRLVVAVDEFATLATQHPDVLDCLVRVAAQGRSLGIHLVLATQRPAGAVSPAIRANTTLRVCLRVLDVGDSRDVLGHDGAAALAPHPGRVLVTGAGSADAGGPAQAPWCGSEAHLGALVAEVRAAARTSSPPWRPWAPPLPTSLGAQEAVALGPATGPADGLVLAATDHPQEQRLGHWRWSADQPLAVLGSPGSGRTTAALAAATSALESGLAVSLCLAGAAPPQLAAVPGTGLGTVVGPEDPRRLTRLWSLAAAGELAGELVVVDDADAMAAAVDEVLGPGEGQGLLELMVRTAPATGTGLVVTAPLAMAGARWAARIGLRLVLGAPQPAQAAVAGLPRGVVTGSGAGRGVIVDGAADADRALAVQVIVPRAPRRAPGRPAHRLAAIPRTVPPGPGTWAVGGDGALPLPVPRGCVLVVGPPGSGRTTALRALQRCRHEAPEELLVVDDLDMAEAAVHVGVEEALRAGRSVLASASTERTVATYRGPLATLRERGDLVVLWPALGPASQVAGRSLRPVTDPRALTLPGRGALVSRASAVPLQVAGDAGAAAG